MTDKVFQRHCYVVPQHDAHWPYLTCRETMVAAAKLYQASPSEVDSTIHKMGLDICANVRNASLSGGQRRRLSIGLALLKKPTVLFLGTYYVNRVPFLSLYPVRVSFAHNTTILLKKR